MGFFDFFNRKGSAEDNHQKREEEKTKGISKPFTEMGFAELEKVTDAYITQYGLNGLSKQEAGLAGES